MITIISGPRTCLDFDLVCLAIEESGFEISEIVSGTAKGVDKLGEKFGNENGISIKRFKPLWSNIKGVPKKYIKQNKWGKYNSQAGLIRNQKMADYAEALIAIKLNKNGNAETNHMIKTAEEYALKVYIHTHQKQLDEYHYHF